MEQIPALTPVTVVPLTVQIPGVVEVKLATKPEVAVAETVPVPLTETVGAAPKVMVCLDLPMVMDLVTAVAAL